MKLSNLFSFLMLFGLGAFLLSFSACKNDFNNIEVVSSDAEFAIPLASTSFSLTDLLGRFEETTMVSINDDGCITVTYEGDLLQQGSEDILASFNAALPPALPLLDTFSTLPLEQPQGIDIQLINLKAGTIGYAFDNEHAGEVEIEFQFPQVTKNGEMLVIDNITVNGPGSYNSLPPTGFPVNVEGYSIDPDDDGNLQVRYIATKENGTRDTLKNVFIGLINFEFAYVEGHLGMEPFENSPGNIDVDLFEEFLTGEVWFQEPRITMSIENSIGLPARSRANYFRVITVAGDTLPLRSDELGPDLEVDFAYPALNEVGESKITSYTFTKDNSNIDSILGAGPVAIQYHVDAIPNPDGQTDEPGFIACESKFTLSIKAELPMYGRASNFAVDDDFNIDLSGYDRENVKAIEFKIVSENELPMDIGLQGYFLDADTLVFDSLFTEIQTIIASPMVDNNGIAQGAERQEHIIVVDAERLPELISKAKQIRLFTTFSTTDNGDVPVKVLASQEVRLRMGMKVLVDR